MKKKKILKKVTEKVNPLIKGLKKYQLGEYPMEEYGFNFWGREDIQKICNLVFEETYKLTNATSTKNRK